MEIKERPILFNGGMVRAIRSGQKTQTRRIIKFPEGWEIPEPEKLGHITSPHPKQGKHGVFIEKTEHEGLVLTDLIVSPYGKPGDRLWGRETFAEAG